MPKTVLTIDDDFTVRALIRACLGRREGYRVLLAENGKQGLELAAAQRPGLILLDWMMPGMDGLEVLGRLKTSPATADIPVVMLTARELMSGSEMSSIMMRNSSRRSISSAAAPLSVARTR